MLGVVEIGQCARQTPDARRATTRQHPIADEVAPRAIGVVSEREEPVDGARRDVRVL